MTLEQVQTAAELWLKGHHTHNIARALDLDEPDVCRCLPSILAMVRAMRLTATEKFSRPARSA
jgi:hypothetical protein